MRATKVLNMTLQGAWEEWKQESGFSVTFSTFAARRPSSVRLVDNRPWEQCLCEYCCNIELKLLSLNKVAKRKVLKNRYEVSKVTQCPEQRRACYERRCKDCGIENLCTVYNDINKNQEVKWRRWGRVVEMCDGKAVRKQKFIDRTGSVRECLDEPIAESIPFAKQLFNARWQYSGTSLQRGPWDQKLPCYIRFLIISGQNNKEI